MEQIRPEIRTFIIGAVTMSTGAWGIAFNLGAFHTIFFTDLFNAWAVVTAILLAVLLLPPGDSPLPWWGVVLLTVPTLGLGLFYVGHHQGANVWLDRSAVLVGTVSYLISLPYAFYVGINVVNADFLSLPSRRLRISLIAVVFAIISIAYVAGSNNDALLTCGDFRISGNDQPPNCRPGPPLTF